MMSRLTRILFAVTVINFGVWGVITTLIQGDAINGKREGGKYYVAMKGRYTEVSKSVYVYSYIHTCTNFILFPATILSGLLGTRTKVRNSNRDRSEDSPEE